MEVHGFKEENITVLLDDGEHPSPTKENMVNAYRQVVADSEDGDAIFLHYSGHGTKLKDDDGDEDDGYDEALCPLDYNESGFIKDDDLYDLLIKPLASGVHMVSLMDCCHSGTILDLPMVFRPDGSTGGAMVLDETIDIDGLMEQFGGHAINFIQNFLEAA